MIYKTFDIALELKQTSTNPTFEIVEGDTGNRVRITVTDGGSPVNLTGCRVIAVFSKPSGLAMQDSAGENGGGIEIGGAYNNEVMLAVYLASVAPGNIECELQIYSGEDLKILVTTARFNFKCKRAVMNGDALQSEEEFPLLVNLISTVQGFTGAEAEREAAEAVRREEYEKWVNIQATAESVPSDEVPHVEITDEGGVKTFAFSIPKAQGSGDMEKSVYDADRDGVVDKAADADKLGGKPPSEYQPKGNYALASIAVAVALPVSGWSDNQQAVSIAGVTATSNVIISPDPASRTVWSDAEIYCSAQVDGKLTFTCAAVPSEAVTANVLIVG